MLTDDAYQLFDLESGKLVDTYPTLDPAPDLGDVSRI